LSQGYEGIILRDPRSVYVEGRVKASDPTFLKYKPLIDSEAVIIGFEEQLHNGNEAFISENGRTKRSSSIIGKTPANTLGAFIVRWGDVEFTIGGGIGLTAELRKEIWNNREQYLGKLIKFSYLGCGTKDKPRMPKFRGFRHPDDISH
jgi:DNA ligase-1